MTDSVTKNRISWWLLKARRQRDHFIKFVLYWFCFNAWLTNLSKKDTDRGAINWFKQNDSCLKSCTEGFWRSSKTQALLKNLKNLSPVYDDRPGHRGEEVELRDINDIGQVIEFIYQIRCNLFHGSKSPMDRRHSNLVELSSRILEKWMEWAQLKC